MSSNGFTDPKGLALMVKANNAAAAASTDAVNDASTVDIVYTISDFAASGATSKIGQLIYISDANSGVGTVAFYDGTIFRDIKTGVLPIA